MSALDDKTADASVNLTRAVFSLWVFRLAGSCSLRQLPNDLHVE